MGKEFTNLTWDDLCDLMCGRPEDEEEWEEEQAKQEAEVREEQ